VNVVVSPSSLVSLIVCTFLYLFVRALFYQNTFYCSILFNVQLFLARTCCKNYSGIEARFVSESDYLSRESSAKVSIMLDQQFANNPGKTAVFH